MTSHAPPLEAIEVSVARGGKTVVSGVDLELGRGEIVALLGPNGAGKSTLVRGLAGLDPLCGGKVRAVGRVTASLQVPALARRSVIANVEAALSWSGSERAGRRERAMEALKLMDAAHLAGRRALDLSGGEARRVHLARSIAVDPDVLLLDEPFAGLDAATRGDLLYDVASAIRDPSRATMVVVHDRAEAWALADRVLVMIGGRLAASGTPRDVLENPSTPEVARFVGFVGELDLGNAVLLLRPADVRNDPRGELAGTVLRKIPVEEGFRVDVAVDRGTVVMHLPPPGPEIGSGVRLRTVGGVRFPKSTEPVSL